VIRTSQIFQLKNSSRKLGANPNRDLTFNSNFDPNFNSKLYSNLNSNLSSSFTSNSNHFNFNPSLNPNEETFLPGITHQHLRLISKQMKRSALELKRNLCHRVSRREIGDQDDFRARFERCLEDDIEDIGL
jgi:hypothetical protein